MEDDELKKMVSKYAEQVAKMAAEAGQVLDRTVAAMEASAKQAYNEVSREAKPHTDVMRKLARGIMDEVKNDIPRIRNELREMEDRAKRKLRDLQGK